jgi:hypothetical protein
MVANPRLAGDIRAGMVALRFDNRTSYGRDHGPGFGPEKLPRKPVGRGFPEYLGALLTSNGEFWVELYSYDSKNLLYSTPHFADSADAWNDVERYLAARN